MIKFIQTKFGSTCDNFFLLFLVDEIEDVIRNQGDRKSNVEFDSIVVYDFRPSSLRFSLLHQNINRIRELWNIFFDLFHSKKVPCNFRDGREAPL